MESTGESTGPVIELPPHELPPRPSLRATRRPGLGSAAVVAAGAAALLAAWAGVSLSLGAQVVPDPYRVARLMWSDAQSGTLLHHLGITMLRVAVAAALAMLCGGLAGVWMGLSRNADMFWASWLVAALTVPRLLIIVVAYLLIGFNDVAAVAATTLAVAPGVAVALREGTRALDWKLVDMGRAFRVATRTQWRRIMWPQLLPYAAGSARNALSLSWKMVLFAELMGRPSGVGYQIAFYFQMFNMGQILAYGTATILVAAVLELAMSDLERRVFRWRPELVT